MEQMMEQTTGTVARAVLLLARVAAEGTTTIKSLSQALSLAPSTVHRLLDLLASQGMIEHDQKHRRYSIGPEFYRVSALVVTRYDLVTLALPILREVVAEADESCVLGLYWPSQRRMSFAKCADSTRPLRYRVQLNTPLPIVWGASGRSILAHLPEEEVAHVLAEETASPGKGEALPSPEALTRELAEIRARGYAISRGQKIAGAVGISAPVFGASGKVIGSLSITIPEIRFVEEQATKLGQLIRNRAGELSTRLGYLGQPARNDRLQRIA
jgi:DNA-binding IclR family transcriptional regulator